MLLKLFIVFYLGSGINSDIKERISHYIAEHKDIAVAEKERTGIPASIKLAQALLESSYGSSDLALKANNHFGIKCGSKWSGGSYHLKDDDYVKGKLVKSCFRKYTSAYESFIAHSEFLTDPKKQYRYGFLFRYDSSDYESWAYGLYDAGYATDPAYPEKLISIIEKYELFIYDGMESSMVRNIETPKNKNNFPSFEYSKKQNKSEHNNAPSDELVIQDQEQKSTAGSHSKNRYRNKTVNDREVIVAAHQETLLSFAKKNGLKVEKLLDFNERFENTADLLMEGEYVFVEEKQNSFEGNKDSHRVKSGESLYDIAQKYGIKLKSIYAKNRLPLSAQVKVGERVSLKGRIKLGDRPEFIMQEGDIAAVGEFLF